MNMEMSMYVYEYKYEHHSWYLTFIFNPGAPSSFCHEHASIGIFKLLISENHLMPHFMDHGLSGGDIHFIQELILGDWERDRQADIIDTQ